ncbi:MAG: ATP-binding protein [Mariprofundaceae bacterium]
MSLWIVLLVAVVLILWGMHVQHLGEKRRVVEDELRQLKLAHRNMESTLVNRGRRMDVLLSAVNEVVMRVDYLGRVMAANAHAGSLFKMNQALGLPQSMLVFYRDTEWHRAFSKALKRLPEPSALPDMHVGERVLAPRLAPLGKDQALLLCVDVTEKYKIELQRKSLFANLMHDLKTPLTSILGYARSIEAFGDDPEVRDEAIQVIANESLRANEFLDALLTLEHVDNFEPDPSAKSDLNQVVGRVLHGFSSQIEARGLTIEWSGQSKGSETVDIKMAESDLHRVLDNLIENALRYTPEKSTIYINGTAGENRFQLEIVDQGDGVPERELARLTERFYRGDKARSKSADIGHGLGLAIVKELLEKYGGMVKINNHDQYGLSVRVTLPIE